MACIETTKAETFQDAATTPKVTFNSVAFDCKALALLGDNAGTLAQAEALISVGSNNLYSTDSGGGSYASSLNGVINGVNENNATVSNALASDSFFDVVDYIGAVKDSSSAWYSGWTLENSLN